ncbi:MAG: site-specific DNA-methyltransferase [Candidatus Kuenenia sp.]|nr:site-specific DNA-methyltransferase [Candidatus Kuenenia hertensis]
MAQIKTAYKTKLGLFYQCDIGEILKSKAFARYKKKVNLIFTSPPFPLNRKKKYGNFNGKEYTSWLSGLALGFRDFLTKDGSIVIELGNAWEANRPIMSTLPLRALLEFQEKGKYFLCQHFIWFNTARLPSPVQWVNVERVRVKDAFTHIWWLSKTPHPKANNRNVLEEYSESMKKLLNKKKYNSGRRPSEHSIGEKSFLKDNNGAIPPNVLIGANTNATSKYIEHCKRNKIELHPARMPEFIPDFFIKFLTDPGDLVFDPFGGSNTTGCVAEKLKRKWISVEINESYIKGSEGRFKI